MIIYKVTNMVNGKLYIGQTTRTLEQRWREHCCSSSQCTYLHNAIVKYGKENFKIEQIDIALDQEELDYKEQQYIKCYDTLVPNGYNLTTGGNADKRYSEVVCFDGGWDFPQMYEHIEKVKAVVESHGIKFTIVRPEQSFDYLMFDKPVKEHKGGTHYGYSWCGLKGCRWGTTEKLKAFDVYYQDNPDCVQYVGIAIDEPDRLEKERKGTKHFPLAEWGMTEQDCLEYCYNLGYDWGGLYEQLDRVSCKFCALKNLKELRNIYHNMPDVWDELRDYQSRTRFPYKGEGKSVPELEVRFNLEDEFLRDGKSIRNKEFFDSLRERLER